MADPLEKDHHIDDNPHWTGDLVTAGCDSPLTLSSSLLVLLELQRKTSTSHTNSSVQPQSRRTIVYNYPYSMYNEALSYGQQGGGPNLACNGVQVS